MNDSSTGAEALAAAKHAIGRVRALRARGIPYDPLTEMASLRGALAGEGSDLALVSAAELEVACTRVELAWTDLEALRAAIASRAGAVRTRGGRPPASMATAEEFLRTWSEPFPDPLTLEGRVWLARRLEQRLGEGDVAGPAANEARPSSAPTRGIERPVSSKVAPTSVLPPAREASNPPAPHSPRLPFLEWLRTPSGLTFLAVGAFLVLGAFDRLNSLGADSLWNDEGQSTLLALSIVQHGYPVITSQHLINNFEPLYPYFEALSVVVLGNSNVAYRLPAAIFGILLIPVSYYVGSRLRDRYVGIALAAMVAFSSELIGWSRQARWYVLLVLIMALAMLAATAWARSHDPHKRHWLFLGLIVLGALAGLTSIGLFLLYIPAIFAAILVYFLAANWSDVRRFFGVPEDPDEPLPTTPIVPYWLRQLVLILVPSAIVIVALAAPDVIGHATSGLLASALGFAPYPLVWSSNFGGYLVTYYLGVLALVGIGAIFMVWRREPLDLALLTFCISGFLGVSSLASLTNNIASGNASFERHLVPLLFFLFLVAAIGVVELLRTVRTLLSRVPLGERLPARRFAHPVVFGTLVVAILVLPGIVVPSNLPLHQAAAESPMGVVSPFSGPFSLAPAYPSSIYQADQANYQAASAYVSAHRNSTDVVGATNPGPPQIYLGAVQYWVRGDPDNSTIITVDGQAEFFQTGSVLLATAAQLESVMFNHSGWLISDIPKGSSTVFPGGMSFVLSKLMAKPLNATTIVVYSWNQTSPFWMLQTLAGNTPSLQRFQNDPADLDDWAATGGITTSFLAGVLLPLDPYLVAHSSSQTRPLAVLLQVYENRPDLQARFPGMDGSPADDRPLIAWAYTVTTGAVSDPAAAALEPYRSWYQTNE